MTLRHPQSQTAPDGDLSILPIFELEGRGRIPRHELPSDDMPADVAYQIVHDELMLDGNARMNLATFVTTWMEPRPSSSKIGRIDRSPSGAVWLCGCLSVMGSPSWTGSRQDRFGGAAPHRPKQVKRPRARAAGEASRSGTQRPSEVDTLAAARSRTSPVTGTM